MNVEVRATGLRAMREKKGLTQRELAHNLGISQNYIPALESGARRPGPKLRQALIKFFNVNFEDLFEVVMVNPESSSEQDWNRGTSGLRVDDTGHRSLSGRESSRKILSGSKRSFSARRRPTFSGLEAAGACSRGSAPWPCQPLLGVHSPDQ